MENLAMNAFRDAYRGKRVLLTGHTGFKGSWLSEWLIRLGAEVHGLSLDPSGSSMLFERLGLATRLKHRVGDIRSLACVRDAVDSVAPNFVFHLAAQSLVRFSYEQPVETYATNVLGTVHVLEAVRLAARPCVIIAVTTDKCYENREWVHGYREEDRMGGFDPYSSSKGAAELAIAAYRNSYFSAAGSRLYLASARAGNVIGGGDWAPDRIMPDCVRCLERGDKIPVRNPAATRPWQHVLEPLGAYLHLGAVLHRSLAAGSIGLPLRSAFNFGPALESNRCVADFVREVLKHWPGSWADCSAPNAHHETILLNLATDKAYHLLQWRPVWSFEEAVRQTVRWYRDCPIDTAGASRFTQDQIAEYMQQAHAQGLAWTE